jgi:hypothetical protein
MEEKSERYRKAESVGGIFLFILFCAWCPIYLIIIRPMINAKLANYISSYPAFLHLIPIMAPIVIVSLIFGQFMPPKYDELTADDSSSTRKSV